MVGVSFGYNVLWRTVSFVGPNSILEVISRFDALFNCFWRVLSVIGKIKGALMYIQAVC